MDAPSKDAGNAGRGGSKLGIALAALALLLSIAAVGLTFARSGVAPRTVSFTVTIDEGQIVTGWNNTCECAVEIDTPAADTEKVVGEYVRWAPNVLIINTGDTVKLTVNNPRGGDHSFAIDAAAGSFSGTTSSGTVQGRDNSGNPAGTQVTIEFTALKAGTYVFRCTIVFDDALNHCHPDHDTLTGTIVVL
jgi:plastocyanin